MAPQVKKKSRAQKSASQKKASSRKTAAEKATAKKTPAKKTPAKHAAVENVARKAATKAGRTKAATPQTGRKKKKKQTAAAPAEASETTITLDELAEVDILVADETPPPARKSTRAVSPRTPTVPRSVKPPPKDAALEMDTEILAFVEAIETYRQEHCRPFPTWTEVFFILKQLGYTKQ